MQEDISACPYVPLIVTCPCCLGWVAPYSFLRSNQPYPSRFSRVGGAWSGSFITSRKYGDSMSPTGFSIEDRKGNE